MIIFCLLSSSSLILNIVGNGNEKCKHNYFELNCMQWLFVSGPELLCLEANDFSPRPGGVYQHLLDLEPTNSTMSLSPSAESIKCKKI